MSDEGVCGCYIPMIFHGGGCRNPWRIPSMLSMSARNLGICLDEFLTHAGPLRALAAEDHIDGWDGRRRLSSCGHVDEVLLHDSEGPLMRAPRGPRRGCRRHPEGAQGVASQNFDAGGSAPAASSACWLRIRGALV